MKDGSIGVAGDHPPFEAVQGGDAFGRGQRGDRAVEVGEVAAVERAEDDAGRGGDLGVVPEPAGLLGRGRRAAGEPGRAGLDDAQAGAVRRRRVTSHGADEDGHVAAGAVQLREGGVASLAEVPVGALHAVDPAAVWLSGTSRDPLADLAYGRCSFQVDGHALQSGVECVRVGVDEARQHGAAAEVDQLRSRHLRGPNLVVVADGGDPAVADRHGRRRRMLRVHGDDRAADQLRVHDESPPPKPHSAARRPHPTSMPVILTVAATILVHGIGARRGSASPRAPTARGITIDGRRLT